MIVLQPDEIKQRVKKDLSSFITDATLNIMLSGYGEWEEGDREKVFQPNKNIASKSDQEMAHILFHFPLNSLIKRIIQDNTNGSELIESLTTEQSNLNMFSIISAETGWRDDDTRQILSVLFRHHTWAPS
eukprot:87802_1